MKLDSGIVLVDKEQGFTSRDIVNIISKKIGIKKIGHTGTLDPLATGVLVLCIGKATKLVSELTASNKEYIAEITLGVETDTLDITGNILRKENYKLSDINKEELIRILNSFKGEYDQEVPKYSAVKVKGRKLYDYARHNECITLPSRLVSIYDIKLLALYEGNESVKIRIQCQVSKGTYIRSLIRDICKRMNVIGTMSSLKRIRQGNFKIEDCKKCDDISLSDIYSIKDIIALPQIKMDDQLYFKVKNGQTIKNIYNKDKIMFIYKDKVVAIYKKSYNYLKPYIMIGEI